MVARIKIPSPSLDATIFAFRLSILQRQTIVSPRDGTRVHTESLVPFATIGTVPKASTQYPSLDTPFVWSGQEVGQSDERKGWSSEIRGRFPRCDKCRWSTLPGSVANC